ncbi:response regulator [Methylobacterium sp. PvR107]|uniref:response regulator n=1 Tax=Methylobacterium sp. PvR107 TaxID=2806597 RepID=UPI001AE6ECF5|nr:response regulator [Methylobacterium sp. PvR107]MBP1178095.1 CheY-like chemotaxis protein [Methylobacterium sp. PvR107]
MSDPRQMPVLVVDDVPMIRVVVRAVLEQVGVSDVHEAPDGAAALAMLDERSYGLVISDLHMSPMSGFELLHRVREDRRLRETLFVMMTIKEHAHAFTAVRKAGVNACLTKPFMPAALRKTLEGLWGGEDEKPSEDPKTATVLLWPIFHKGLIRSGDGADARRAPIGGNDPLTIMAEVPVSDRLGTERWKSSTETRMYGLAVRPRRRSRNKPAPGTPGRASIARSSSDADLP